MSEIGEGVTSRIYVVSPTIVKKIQKRNKNKVSARYQYQVQQIASELQFTTLYIPRVYEYGANWYTMERIDTTRPLNTTPEEVAFCSQMQRCGYIANDYELYLQPDGRVALVDFDRFITASI